MKLVLKSWYPLVSGFIQKAFLQNWAQTEFTESSFTTLWQVSLQCGSEEASDIIPRTLLIQNTYAWKNYATAWKGSIFCNAVLPNCIYFANSTAFIPQNLSVLPDTHTKISNLTKHL